jgi:hypothetical protein
MMPQLVEDPDWPSLLALWKAKSAVITPYGSFDVHVSCPRGVPLNQVSLQRAVTLADFTHDHIETIVDLAHAHFRWALRTWGGETFQIMEIPTQNYSRQSILTEARSRYLFVTCDENGGILGSGISIGVQYDEEHGLSLDFDGSRISSINGEPFEIVNGELVFAHEGD